MKISYITVYDPLNVHNWSGLVYNIAKSLERQNAEIDYIGNLKKQLRLGVILKIMFLRGIKRMHPGDRNLFLAKIYSKQAERKINTDTDIILSPGTLPIALMKNSYPKVFYTDATFAGMLDFYPDFSNFSNEAIRIGNFLEQKALDNCTMAIYSSDWAAETAILNYKVDPEKIKVVPFGANFSAPKEFADIKGIVQKRSKTKCKLLFLSVDWERKGGRKALDIVQALIIQGIEAELHVVGIDKIPELTLPSFVISHGFLSKSSLDGINRLEQLLSDCHFLLLPTLADCTPIVFCEASSFGLPSLCTKVGGIPTIVKDDVNGKTFSTSDDAIEYSTYIKKIFFDFSRYENLCYSSFREFQNRLNWGSSGKKLMVLLESISRS
jgi:glycosyltransferase involved in cell wall biosynthesis